MNDTKTILLFGRPGSGKGTQATLLAEKLGWTHFSTGNIFKEMREAQSVMGERVRAAYDTGKLLPDWFATYLFEDKILAVTNEQGVVCEGYPRSKTQAEEFDNIMSWLERPYAVFHLMVSEEETMRRMLERAKVENRPDSSTTEQIHARFLTYEAATAPVLDFFQDKGNLIEINGEQSIDTVFSDIEKALISE